MALEYCNDLKLELPADSLIPTLGLRLNFICYLRDALLAFSEYSGRDCGEFSGIDIGCGASCIFPQIFLKLNNKQSKNNKYSFSNNGSNDTETKNNNKFYATECNQLNFEAANANIRANNYGNQIKLFKSNENQILDPLLLDDSFSAESQLFLISNPPFFPDSSTTNSHTKCRSVETPSKKRFKSQDCETEFCSFGEIQFCSKIIEDFLRLKTRIKFCLVLIGKKSSLKPLKEVLRHHELSYCHIQLFQGKTIRWALLWSAYPEFIKLYHKTYSKAKAGIFVEKMIKDCISNRINSLESLIQRCQSIFASMNIKQIETTYQSGKILYLVGESIQLPTRKSRREEKPDVFKVSQQFTFSFEVSRCDSNDQKSFALRAQTTDCIQPQIVQRIMTFLKNELERQQ
ncbi:MAG: Methyltransferase-like protein 16 [Marteilia pararefringens]